MRNDNCLCSVCQKKLIPKFINFDIDGIEGLSIYEYDDNIKSLLYQFKGCYDYELKDIFLFRYKYELRIRYHSYVVVPVPSYGGDDQRRGFNHVEEIFKSINLPIVKSVVKFSPFKQAEHERKQRSNIAKHLRLIDGVNLNGKNVLLVDDVCTTGATLRAMIALLKQAGAKKIKILVMSKRIIK